MKKKILIAPSLLAADFANLSAEMKSVEKAGADLFHVDIMDGHFVPNITIGPAVVSAIRAQTKLPISIHLMIEHPDKYIDVFAKSGGTCLTFHIETCPDPLKTINLIKSFGLKAGVAFNPKTGLGCIRNILGALDMVLFMTVEPGFGGQLFMPSVLSKISQLRQIWNGDIEVDGGINQHTAKEVLKAGANILAVGTAIFKAKNRKKAIKALRKSK
ncbi:MAG: ribulose-phosphate 3-epimerase [Candidatus Omnitrophota bacterium]|nr:ribulose-phosphate 3-epimerase [Candidatus Omnitrophota bacterium]